MTQWEALDKLAHAREYLSADDDLASWDAWLLVMRAWENVAWEIGGAA